MGFFMLKYLIYLTAGYLIFKVVKNGVYLALENLQKPSGQLGTTELVKCDQCGSFFKETTTLFTTLLGSKLAIP